MSDRTIEELDETESLRLISPGGVGRIVPSRITGRRIRPAH